MINIWDYANAKKVKIIAIDGNEYTGNVVDISDVEENEREEDDITIYCKGEYVAFMPSEIVSIEAD